MRGAPQAARGGDVSRTTVDLTAFPDPVVIYLGMCVRTPRGWARHVAGHAPLAREADRACSRGPTRRAPRSGYSRLRRLGRRAARSSPPGGEPISKVRKNSRQCSPMARRGEHRRFARAPHNRAHSPRPGDRWLPAGIGAIVLPLPLIWTTHRQPVPAARTRCGSCCCVRRSTACASGSGPSCVRLGTGSPCSSRPTSRP